MATRRKKFTASVWREGKWFIAQCLEVDVASQGSSERAALRNLADALELHFARPTASAVPKLRPVEIKLSAA
ncbi:MAG TPA: type II toxin-antitoxin system HicB family antitoxin [Alphaproteobacteria bacterium]|jgi:predicted RNase H-like HicB family nuclease